MKSRPLKKVDRRKRREALEREVIRRNKKTLDRQLRTLVKKQAGT